MLASDRLRLTAGVFPGLRRPASPFTLEQPQAQRLVSNDGGKRTGRQDSKPILILLLLMGAPSHVWCRLGLHLSAFHCIHRRHCHIRRAVVILKRLKTNLPWPNPSSSLCSLVSRKRHKALVQLQRRCRRFAFNSHSSARLNAFQSCRGLLLRSIISAMDSIGSSLRLFLDLTHWQR